MGKNVVLPNPSKKTASLRKKNQLLQSPVQLSEMPSTKQKIPIVPYSPFPAINLLPPLAEKGKTERPQRHDAPDNELDFQEQKL